MYPRISYIPEHVRDFLEREHPNEGDMRFYVVSCLPILGGSKERIMGEVGSDAHHTCETQPVSGSQGMGPTRGSVPKEMKRGGPTITAQEVSLADDEKIILG